MDKVFKVGVALAGVTLATVAAWQLLKAKEDKAAASKATAGSKPQKELYRLREQRKSSSTISQPEEAHHDIYRLYQSFAQAEQPLSNRYVHDHVQLDAFPMELDEIVLYPEDLLIYCEKTVTSDGLPTLYTFSAGGEQPPVMILTLDGDCFVMGFTSAERFVASGPEFSGTPTIGYLEAVLETLTD